MEASWPGLTDQLRPLLKDLRGGAPEVMKAFSAIAQAALAPKALDTKTKELVALGISVAIRCDDCIAFHVKAALDQGATRDEVLETLGTAIYLGAGRRSCMRATLWRRWRNLRPSSAAKFPDREGPFDAISIVDQAYGFHRSSGRHSRGTTTGPSKGDLHRRRRSRGARIRRWTHPRRDQSSALAI